jgi:hypothetical protein
LALVSGYAANNSPSNDSPFNNLTDFSHISTFACFLSIHIIDSEGLSMLPLPTRSPFDGGEVVVTRYYCPGSDVTVEGRFTVSTPFAQLTPEQLHFVETFLRCEGKISRMEGELNISYPTVRSRLHEIIRALGYEPGREETGLNEEKRRSILAALDRGELTFDTAMKMLEGEEE